MSRTAGRLTLLGRPVFPTLNGIRYNNRFEIRSAGHQLKPVWSTACPVPGLNLADESKGIGIHIMIGRLTAEAGLTLTELNYE